MSLDRSRNKLGHALLRRVTEGAGRWRAKSNFIPLIHTHTHTERWWCWRIIGGLNLHTQAESLLAFLLVVAVKTCRRPHTTPAEFQLAARVHEIRPSCDETRFDSQATPTQFVPCWTLHHSLGSTVTAVKNQCYRTSQKNPDTQQSPPPAVQQLTLAQWRWTQKSQ